MRTTKAKISLRICAVWSCLLSSSTCTLCFLQTTTQISRMCIRCSHQAKKTLRTCANWADSDFLRMRKVSRYISFQMLLLADSEGPDQPAQLRRLIWAFAVRICPKVRFRMGRRIWPFLHWAPYITFWEIFFSNIRTYNFIRRSTMK